MFGGADKILDYLGGSSCIHTKTAFERFSIARERVDHGCAQQPEIVGRGYGIGATVDVVQRIAETVNGTSVTSAAVQNTTANTPGQDNDQADA